MLDLEQQIFRQIEKSKSILVAFPSNGDNDSVASALALFLFLEKIGYSVDIASHGAKEDKSPLHFLPGYSKIQKSLSNLRRFIVSLDITKAKVSQIKYSVDNNKINFIVSPSEGWFENKDVSTKTGSFKYDLIFVLGASDLESLGKLYDNQVEFFYKTPIINIDHQPANEEFGQINFVDLNAVSTTEILFYLLKNYKEDLIDEDVATCLLAGIINKTKNFKTMNLTPRTLLTTSQLISLGGRREEIINNLYRSRSLSTLKLWGKILSTLRTENNDQLIWSKITANEFKETGANEDGLVEIIDELIANVPNAKLIAIFREESASQTRLLIYSPKNINALDIIRDLQPKGTIKISYADINQDLSTACLEIISSLKNKLEKLS